MKKYLLTLITVIIGILLTCNVELFAAEKIRVLVVVGGHDFQTNQFYQMFKDNEQISFEVVEHPNALPRLKPDSVANIDVIVLYDLWQKISDEQKQDFLNYLKSGKGLLVLHHAIANYQDWQEYEKIIGARYYLKNTVVNGVEKLRSQYKHGVKFKVNIADKNHPVTRGIEDFEIIDETYRLFDVAEDNTVLLTTDEPTSNKNIGWAKTYNNARVVYIQLGHDSLAYKNPNYRKLVAQAIQWVAKKVD